jgi:hypothetical protein
MAIRRMTNQALDSTASVEENMKRTGLDRFAVEVYLAVQSGDALVDDLARVPPGQREAILQAGEAAEDAYLAAMERAAAVVDPAATVEENLARTGLDRRTIEVYLAWRRGNTSDDPRDAG